MKCRILSVFVASLIATASYAENPVASGLDSYLRMRQEYRENLMHEQNLEIQRQQLELQRQQLEMLKDVDRREQERSSFEVKKKQASSNELNQQIREHINRNLDEQYELFLKLYPEYKLDKSKEKLLNSTMLSLQKSTKYADKILDLGSFTEILMDAHKIVQQGFKKE